MTICCPQYSLVTFDKDIESKVVKSIDLSESILYNGSLGGTSNNLHRVTIGAIFWGYF